MARQSKANSDTVHHAFLGAVAELAPPIAAALSRRYHADAPFRGRLRRYAVGTLGWTFLGSADDLARLARLAATALLADLGHYAALRRYHPRLAAVGPHPLPPLLKGGEGGDRSEEHGWPAFLKMALHRAFSAAPALPGPPCETFELLRELAIEGLPGRELRRLWADAARYDLGRGPADTIGPLWEDLAPTAERRRAGQFYSGVDPIDLILAFCLRSPTGAVLDPACGSGAFLVRALDRLSALAPETPPAQLARQLHGSDLDPLALRLAGYNVVARCGAAPDLRQADFFALDPAALPPLAAVVGNPPYTRQELLDDRTPGAKGSARRAAVADWGRLVSGRAGLHVPFLLHAAAFLPPGGRLGMLTSNSWLNADYGRDLRRFLLEHCRISAIVAPAGERWFGAAVNALLLIAQREDDAAARLAQRARFVYLKRPLAALIGADARSPERWKAVERLVARIERMEVGAEDGDLRVRAVAQAALRDGDRWAVYLSAPDIYFELRRRAGDGLCPLGELAAVRRGLTTGANAFFYVRDVGEALDDAARDLRRTQREALRIVVAGDGSRHVLETRYLRPVLTSPREVSGLTVDPARLRYRVVLLPPDRAALAGTWALRYVEWGERQAIGRVAALAPAARITCANRPSWWSLAPAPVGSLLWCKTHYARHIAPLNADGVLADCNLYHLIPRPGVDTALLAAALNSTLVALLKELHGRANLGEGALKTEVSDLLTLPVPDPRRLTASAAERVRHAWRELERRPVGGLLDELDRPDRQDLDEAWLAALGHGEPAACREAREQLYAGIAGVLSGRLTAGRGARLAPAVREASAAALAAAALAELENTAADDGREEGSAERERRVAAVLAGFTHDRKLLAAAERLVRARLGAEASIQQSQRLPLT